MSNQNLNHTIKPKVECLSIKKLSLDDLTVVGIDVSAGGLRAL